jgi:hypothetical protein
MLSTQFARRAISDKDTSCMPASWARFRVASERPSRFVSTVHPAFVSWVATAEPIAPAATIPKVGRPRDCNADMTT